MRISFRIRFHVASDEATINFTLCGGCRWVKLWLPSNFFFFSNKTQRIVQGPPKADMNFTIVLQLVHPLYGLLCASHIRSNRNMHR